MEHGLVNWKKTIGVALIVGAVSLTGCASFLDKLTDKWLGPVDKPTAEQPAPTPTTDNGTAHSGSSGTQPVSACGCDQSGPVVRVSGDGKAGECNLVSRLGKDVRVLVVPPGYNRSGKQGEEFIGVRVADAGAISRLPDGRFEAKCFSSGGVRYHAFGFRQRSSSADMQLGNVASHEGGTLRFYYEARRE